MKPASRIQRALRLPPRFSLPLLLLLVGFYAWRPLEGGFDFWAHAAVGRWIFDHGRVPRATLFLWSEPSTPWVAHSWLSQLLFFWMLHFGGPLAVQIYNTVFPTLVFFLLWRFWKQTNPPGSLTAVVFALAIWVCAPRYQPRQELISALLLTVLLAFLVAWAQGRFDDLRRRRNSLDLSLVAAPLVTLFFLWVNLHALVATGLIVLWSAALGDALQSRLGAERDDRIEFSRARTLLAIALLCTLATLLNPYGLAYWKSAEVLRAGSQAQWVEEWKPFWGYPKMPLSYPLVSGVLGALAFFAWLKNPLRRWSQGLWLLFFTATLVRSRRMLMLTAIVYLVVMAANSSAFDTEAWWKQWRRLTRGDIYQPLPDNLRLLARCGVLLCLATWLLAAASRHTPAHAGAWSTHVRNLPEGAARLILAHRLPRRLLNDYEYSSYLHWRVNGRDPGTGHVPSAGRHPLFIDLLNAYPDRLLDEYLEILDASPAGLKSLQRHRVNCVILGRHHWANPKTRNRLVGYLDHHKTTWKRVFRDDQTIIWVRRR